MKKYKKYIFLAVIFVLVLIFDLVTKYAFDGKSFNLIKGVVSVESCHNTGAAFSIFNNSTLFLTIVTLVMFVAITVFYVLTKQTNNWFLIGFSLIISGAFGNIYDRVIFGYVRDFVKLDFVNFAIFNIADSALTVGIVVLIVYFLFFGGFDWLNETDQTNQKQN